MVVNPLGFGPATGAPPATMAINGLAGGRFLGTSAIGAFTPKSVSGTMPGGNLAVQFRLPGGAGSPDPLSDLFSFLLETGLATRTSVQEAIQ